MSAPEQARRELTEMVAEWMPYITRYNPGVLVAAIEALIDAKLAEQEKPETVAVMPKYECSFCERNFLTTEVRGHHEETCEWRI